MHVEMILCDACHRRSVRPTGDTLAGWNESQFVALLNFAVQLEPAEGRVKIRAVGDRSDVEHSSPRGPWALIPFGRGTVGASPCVRRVVIGASVNQRPVHKILAGILRVFVLVKDIGDGELADGKNKPIGCVRTGELILIRFHLLGLASKIVSLAKKETLNTCVRHVRADFE